MTPRHLLEPARLAGSALLRAQSDSRLVDLTRAGNDRAFEAIVDRYNRPLLRYCARILPDGRGEDAVQQVFLNAYNALHRDAAPLSLKGWLFGIAHNVSLNLLRQRGSAHEELPVHEPAGEAADQTVERSERLREVLTAVAALPPSQRDAIVLREIEGRGHEEIARELGVTGGAARQLISRARSGVRAAAASFLPFPLIMRLTDGSTPPPTAARVAELTAAGGGITVAKVVATAAVGTTLVGGAVKAPDIVRSDRGERGENVAQAAAPGGADPAGPGDGDDVRLVARAGAGGDGEARARARRRERAGDDDGNRGEDRGRDERGEEGEPEDGSRGPHDGPDRDEDEDDGPGHRGPGADGLHGGSGGGTERDGHSGPGGGRDREPDEPDEADEADEPDEPKPDRSGPGAGDDPPEEDSSGSGGSGNGGSGKGGSGKPPETPELPESPEPVEHDELEPPGRGTID
jgi:RNA polymerase sigma factor (sigma-70 family)